ncbi:hypothetical protein BDP27DRAFT_318461 [Rhodocollybia butyracea]|uniref:Uncharacterized protein n=1 Tax=Rhodocollybia butyracea TaxID=206335 RepID=A0A9P5PVK5_9AGAR|nr:hypothetical protein BDP27DRAFT_318461 [Rhodocollybia butyracea]
MMIIVGDFLISWRAWIMWPGSRYIKAILIILMMANISFQCLYASSYMSVRVIQGALSLTLDSPWSTLLVSNVLGLITSLAINILSTSLIGVKAWMYRRDWKALRRHNRLTKSQQVLMLWIESGVVFSVLQVVYMFIQLAKAALLAWPGVHAGPSLNSLQNWLLSMIPLLVGLYLITVSLIVKLKLSVVEEMSTITPNLVAPGHNGST